MSFSLIKKLLSCATSNISIWILFLLSQTMFTRIKCFATVAWREKLERIRNFGINRLPSKWLLRDVICSITHTLALPFLVAYSLFPSVGFSRAVNLAVQRLIWPVVLVIIIIGFVAKLTIDLFVYIHRVEYNDRNLVGDRVTDFTEDLEWSSSGLWQLTPVAYIFYFRLKSLEFC